LALTHVCKFRTRLLLESSLWPLTIVSLRIGDISPKSFGIDDTYPPQLRLGLREHDPQARQVGGVANASGQ